MSAAVGDPAARLRVLARVKREDPAYRSACVEAIGLSDQLDTVGLEVENLLAEFIRSGPKAPPEMEAFFTLAELYLRHSFTENGLEAAQKLQRALPGDARVAELLAKARRQGARTPAPVAPPALPPLPSTPRVPTRRLGPAQLPAAPARPTGQLVPGASVADRYELIEEIGRGGMSIVYRAKDDELGEEVALKFLTGSALDSEADARFRQEVKLSRQLVHPNIVRLYDIGQHHELRFLSMELLTGKDLARVLRSGPLPVARSVEILVECCAALQTAHDRGIVHRDVKPANLFITTSGALKVMDFGIAKLQSGGPGLTSPDLFAGTPAYLAPEQIRGFSEVTPVADLYSLGVVAYEMLTGAPPFSHAEPMSLLMMHIQDPPPPPRERNPELPLALEAILLRLLEKLPSRRFASCRELARTLEGIRRLL